MKIRVILILLILITSLSIGCADTDVEPNGDEINDGEVNDEDIDKEDDTDAVTTPSVAIDEETLMKATSKEGTWIIILVDDLTVDKDIILEGEFTKPDRDDESKLIPAGRKLALYAQDENRVKTASYTLRAPKLTIRSEDTTIKGGTFVGDVYVEANGFTLSDGNIQGNIYFSSEEYKNSFILEDDGTVTGNMEILQ